MGGFIDKWINTHMLHIGGLPLCICRLAFCCHEYDSKMDTIKLLEKINLLKDTVYASEG